MGKIGLASPQPAAATVVAPTCESYAFLDGGDGLAFLTLGVGEGAYPGGHHYVPGSITGTIAGVPLVAYPAAGYNFRENTPALGYVEFFTTTVSTLVICYTVAT